MKTNNKISTFEELKTAIRSDTSNHKIKELATLFYTGMNDWPVRPTIEFFIKELKEFYGEPLTKEKIKNKAFSYEREDDSWRHEGGASILQMLELSDESDGGGDFDEIVECILEYFRN